MTIESYPVYAELRKLEPSLVVH